MPKLHLALADKKRQLIAGETIQWNNLKSLHKLWKWEQEGLIARQVPDGDGWTYFIVKR